MVQEIRAPGIDKLFIEEINVISESTVSLIQNDTRLWSFLKKIINFLFTKITIIMIL